MGILWQEQGRTPEITKWEYFGNYKLGIKYKQMVYPGWLDAFIRFYKVEFHVQK